MTGRFCLASLLGFAALAALAGCGSPAAEFRRYETFIRKVELETGAADFTLSSDNLAGVDEAIAALFGTPDNPAVPVSEEADPSLVLDLARLKLAAGAVGSDEQGNARGLYREHCAHCHGITGDGQGPTAAFLNPYPRDYRPGKFKFKSTPVGYKPTHDDLKKILLDGIPGTAMPSFKLLPDLEVEALVHYVKYLSIRGEVERALLKLTTELEPNQRLVSADNATAEEKAVQQEQLAAVKEQVSLVVGKWIDAPAKVVPIPARVASASAEELNKSRLRGRDYFYGIGQCIKCHGESALGDGQLTDYDDWTGEFIGKGADQKKLIAEFVSVGMPEPRNIVPRNLRQGVFRGGLRPIDIYWRVKNGIEGTPMPAATMKPENDPHAKGLTPEALWDIVNYVQSLPFESISDPHQNVPADMRERM